MANEQRTDFSFMGARVLVRVGAGSHKNIASAMADIKASPMQARYIIVTPHCFEEMRNNKRLVPVPKWHSDIDPNFVTITKRSGIENE